MYKLGRPPIEGAQSCSVVFNKAICIPFDPTNTDYQQFKKDILEGKELQDADGNTLSQTEAEAFIATLP